MVLNVVFLFFVLSLWHANILLVESTLTLNETFHDLSNWVVHLDGYRNIVGFTKDPADGYCEDYIVNKTDPSYNILYTNVTECGIGHCYRAELAQLRKLRPKIIPSPSAEYWAGVSFYIPKSFHWKPTFPKNWKRDCTIHYQLHGGDNDGNSPIVGIRQTGEQLYVQLCGNTYNLEPEICTIYDIGQLVQGQWIDIVMHSQLAAGLDETTGKPKGWFKLWRNNRLMVNETQVLTAYVEENPPYVIVGSYQINWKYYVKAGYHWAAAYHKAVRVGDANSYYDEVYTGDGTMCGSECDKGHSPFILNRMFWWVIIPFMTIFIGSAILFLASDTYRQRRLAEWKRQQAAEATAALNPEENDDEEGSHATIEETEEGELNMSYDRFLAAVDAAVAKQQKPPSFLSTQWKRFKAQFKNSSRTRTIFWYGFAFFWCWLTIYLGAMFYGLPWAQHIPTEIFDGIVPWKGVKRWTFLQVTMIAISSTTICVYFLPLLYLPHDFEAGKKWKNDPDFLRRIGVIIPCHKSANEIGEVIRRVLNYIPPENIVVCDNGDNDWPPDNTFEVVKAMHPSIRYLYIKQGHKTRALWTGAHRLPTRVEYIIHLDDDTHFDEHHMVFDESHFLAEDHVIAVSFLRSSYPTNTVTEYTDFWYKMTDHFHATQAKIATRCFVPGPAGMWRRDKFMEIFGQHPSLPFGEDIFGGFTTLNNGYAIRAETRCMVKTFAPDTMLPNWTNTGRVQGYGASSLWKQRANRWTVSALRITGKSLYSFFTYDTKLGLCSNIAFRFYRFREYKLIGTQVFCIPFLLVIFVKGYMLEFFLLKLALFVLPLMRNLFINYICWRGQPEMQVPLKTVLLSPFFNLFLIICAIHGRWKCILWYLPQIAPKHGFLARCRPQPLTQVPLEDRQSFSLETIHYEEEGVSNCQSYESRSMSADSNSHDNGIPGINFSNSHEIVVRDGPSFALDAFPDDAEADFSMNIIPPGEQHAGQGGRAGGLSGLSPKQLMFELFEREGGSSVFVKYRSAQSRLVELQQIQELLKTQLLENIPTRVPYLPAPSLLAKSLETLEAGTYWRNSDESDEAEEEKRAPNLYPVKVYSPAKSFRTVRTAASSASEDYNDPALDPYSISPERNTSENGYYSNNNKKSLEFPLQLQAINLEMQMFHPLSEEIQL